MVSFCFLLDRKTTIRRTKPVVGSYSRYGRSAHVADMCIVTRFCHIPFYRKSWKAIICSFCCVILKSYR
uniref:Uncharacterized protein n=1 Tax=Nicotiana tabacum TaxID=4097 RepID=A0A1S3XJA3_TOBAC|nr:PREDICTED: uncharacterized protein LOC107765870 [Nicotiana tabacum]